MMRATIVNDPIDIGSLTREAESDSCGATAVFLGTVRSTNEGRNVDGIEYSAYEAMAARELADIAMEATKRFPQLDVAIEHRLGELALEDASVGIAVAHPHRGDAYDASRWVIEELKRRVPIWKREHYADGTREWVNPVGAAAAVTQ